MLYTYIHTTYKVAQYIIQASIINSYNNVQQNSISSRHLLYIHTTYKVAQHFIQTSIIHTYDVQQNSISSRHLLYIQRTVEQYFILTSIHTTTLLVYTFAGTSEMACLLVYFTEQLDRQKRVKVRFKVEKFNFRM